jgi:hypothetical protein
MSSFDITNINSFNDLINRAEILQEKDWKSMVKSAKLRPEFAKYKAEDPKTGKKAPPGGLSRLANLLYITALGEAHLDMISGEVAAALARRSTSSTEIAKMLAEIDPEVFEKLFNDENPKSAEVAEYVSNPENRPKLVQYIIKNYTPKNREFIKNVDPEDLDDAVGDAVDDIENAADDLESRFEKGVLGAVGSEADLKARISELDFDDVDVSLEELENKDEIAAKIVELINTTDNLTAEVTPIGFNIEGPVGVFVDSETITDQMNRLITKYFPNVGGRDIPVRLNTSVGEDNEFDDFDIGPQSDENAPDDYEEVLKAMITKDKEQFAKNMIEDEEKKAKKDYDGDGKIESGEKEYMGSRDRAIKKAMGSSMKESKEYVAQPHLEVSETSTANYLTEQAASDKRNKKTEVKNQSFKERYKPKTQWQLEELRRYGL